MPSRFPGPAAEFLGNVSALLPGAVFPIISSAVVLRLLRSWAQLDLPVCFEKPKTFPKCVATSRF